MEQGVCAGSGGEAEPGGAQFPRARGPQSNAALASGIREMTWAAGDLSWSLPTVTQTPHTWQRAGPVLAV